MDLLRSSRLPFQRLGYGFTLLEVLTVIAVVAVLGAIGLPNFNSLVARYNVRRSIEDLSATIYFARTEAIKRGGNVYLTKKTSTADCAKNTDDKDWSCGWVVYYDTDKSGPTDGNSLQITAPQSNVTITQEDNQRQFVIDAWGQIQNGAGSDTHFKVGSLTDASQATQLTLKAGGVLTTGPAP